MTKDSLRKLLSEATELSKEFGTELRPAYAIDITDAGGVQWMIPEKWFFRYLVAFELWKERWDQIEEPEETVLEYIDRIIEERIEAGCSERYR